MQCAKCGFVMTELDTECLRCKRQGVQNGTAAPVSAPLPAVAPVVAEEKECPRCGKATGMGAAACDKCGYEYQSGGGSVAERYQARMVQEAPTVAPVGLRRTLSPVVSWGIIAVCLLVVFGAGWAIFGGIADEGTASTTDTPIVMRRHRKPKPLVGPQNVTYSVTGTAAQAFVTYGDATTTAAKPETVALPWTLTVKAQPGTHLSLSAASADGTGTVGVSVKVNGTPRKQSYTPGTDGQTTVEDTL